MKSHTIVDPWTVAIEVMISAFLSAVISYTLTDPFLIHIFCTYCNDVFYPVFLFDISYIFAVPHFVSM